ncbi:cyclopropane-fatty-acyl-phospholipid synthase family protein [Rufibacter glacialis]|uniref:Class I SAM-dependent methyltransferase n=1 Tax=Rufibacter glacialis TaxID=1259555 RepID=A0A5M8QPH9_9BACT|nr:class I SAM-dependent methyltransferase [Rufibacter glacialis]KAA6438127.1 class I SAM-dependent methyltransferase [Rufibacter glacialis]GGK88863.1 methyltransferase [Rufibacter glacialis]
MINPSDWFYTWFDSPYYHLLYKNRDAQEAQRFIDNLLVRLRPKPACQLMDLACGKGRHAIYLNQKGYAVTGLDLSEQSIAYARQFENERLHFFVHDMREVFKPEAFDFVFNLFTSFGYFEADYENVIALRATSASLKPGGKLVIDFMNTQRVINRLVAKETKEVEGITFHITRKVEAGFILKTIRFEDKGQSYEFIERVRALHYDEFLEYFQMAQLRLANVYGDYSLGPYDPVKSERMIFILKKYSA